MRTLPLGKVRGYRLLDRKDLLPSDSRYATGPVRPSDDIGNTAAVLYIVHELINHAVALQPEALSGRKFIDPSSRLQIFG